jgi:hypothetical protein
VICASVVVCVRKNIVGVYGVRTGSVMYVHKRVYVHIARSGEYVGNYAPLHCPFLLQRSCVQGARHLTPKCVRCPFMTVRTYAQTCVCVLACVLGVRPYVQAQAQQRRDDDNEALSV